MLATKFVGGGTRNPPDLRVDAVSRLVVWREELGPDAGGKISLDARLLSSKKGRHFGGVVEGKLLLVREESCFVAFELKSDNVGSCRGPATSFTV